MQDMWKEEMRWTLKVSNFKFGKRRLTDRLTEKDRPTDREKRKDGPKENNKYTDRQGDSKKRLLHERDLLTLFTLGGRAVNLPRY